MDIEEKEEICSRALISWMIGEKNNMDFKLHDEDIANLFTSRVLMKKFEVFGIDIVLPDLLLLILNVCTGNNPGQIQIVLKELLNSIKSKNGPIKPGYVITTSDFITCFPSKFPITGIPEIDAKYESLWIGQKIKRESGCSDNLCDTIEWWMEVME